METTHVQKAVTYLGWLFIALIIFIATLALNELKENRYIGGGIPSSNTITLSGEGEVFAVPDIAEVHFSVVEEKKTIAEAQEASATKINAVLAFLKEQGIAEKDIKTVNYSANPRYEWRDSVSVRPAYGAPEGSDWATVEIAPYYEGENDTRVLVGYEVRQTISVKIRDTKKTATVVDGIGEKGATDIFGPTFTIDDQTALEREARKKAIEDAKDKAERLADDLGVRLVRIVNFSENGGGYYPMMFKGAESMQDASVASAPAEMPIGENTIRANVSITYEIK